MGVNGSEKDLVIEGDFLVSKFLLDSFFDIMVDVIFFVDWSDKEIGKLGIEISRDVDMEIEKVKNVV